MNCFICGSEMSKASLPIFYCYKNDDHEYTFETKCKSHSVKSELIPNYHITFNENLFVIQTMKTYLEFNGYYDYKTTSEDFIYWRTLEELKIKIDKVMTFQ